jgi:lysozyme family protein
MQFEAAFCALIDTEGGWSDDPNDPGNWTSGMTGKGELRGTKFGIAANTYGAMDIRNLTLDQAREIYKRDYWDIWAELPGLTSSMPDSLLFELFDASVNAGKGNAARFLQRAVGVTDDGNIGPATLAALDHALLDVGVARVEQWFLAEKLEHYTNLSSWPRYGKGWARRVAKSLRNV